MSKALHAKVLLPMEYKLGGCQWLFAAYIVSFTMLHGKPVICINANTRRCYHYMRYSGASIPSGSLRYVVYNGKPLGFVSQQYIYRYIYRVVKSRDRKVYNPGLNENVQQGRFQALKMQRDISMTCFWPSSFYIVYKLSSFLLHFVSIIFIDHALNGMDRLQLWELFLLKKRRQRETLYKN